MDSETIEIQLLFEEKLDISLYSDSDLVIVTLWGPFVSERKLAPIADRDRVEFKSIPPQLLEDFASRSIDYLTEETVLTSTSLATFASNILKKLLTRGTLNGVLGMITSL